MALKNTVVLYHADCLDGFGGAFAAWKRFGDEASYIPVRHNEPSPTGLEQKEVYIIDFSYPKDTLLSLEQHAQRLVVLDHHVGTQGAVEAVREHIFDNNRSGAGIAWEYFHPAMPQPRLIQYIQDGDLWRRVLPNNKEIGAFLTTIPFDFAAWDDLLVRFESKEEFNRIIEKGSSYATYFDYVVDYLTQFADLVEFEGHIIYAVNAPRLFRSALGHVLAEKKSPFSIVYYMNHGKWHFSMRGDGSIDLTVLAARHGGSGHKNAASFKLPAGAPFPFTIGSSHENSRNRD